MYVCYKYFTVLKYLIYIFSGYNAVIAAILTPSPGAAIVGAVFRTKRRSEISVQMPRSSRSSVAAPNLDELR